MMIKRFFLLFLLFSAWVGEEVSAQATVTAKTDAQQITVGDALHYFVTATVDTTRSRLVWPHFPDTFNTLEITEKGVIDTQRNGPQLTFRQRLLITGFDSGSFRIPRFAFLSIDKSGGVDSVFTDSFRLLVQTVAVDTTKPFKDIKGVAEVSSSWKDNLGMLLALLAGIAVLAWIVVYFLRNRKAAVAPKSEQRQETYFERALRLLDELDAKQLWQQDKPKEYYTELSDIVRQYIEVRFQTNAMELTTDELLRKARKHREMAMFSKSLKPLLQAADLAKFAKAHPLPEEHIEALDMARDFIRVSKPKEEGTPSLNPNTQTLKK